MVSMTQSDVRVPFMVWDVSAHGIGLLLTDGIQAGDSVVLQFSFPTQTIVPCRVAWCQSSEDGDGIRASLAASDPLETGLLGLISYVEEE